MINKKLMYKQLSIYFVKCSIIMLYKQYSLEYTLVHGNTHEFRQIQPHKYVLTSTKDWKVKIIKSEQELNPHLSITSLWIIRLSSFPTSSGILLFTLASNLVSGNTLIKKMTEINQNQLHLNLNRFRSQLRLISVRLILFLSEALNVPLASHLYPASIK
jgi:hypothetical protein